MENVDALWRMEDEFWKGGAETYRRNLSEDSLMVFPGMVSTKAQTIEAISSAPRWISVTFDDRRTVSLADGAVALNYRASARRDGDENPYAALATSIYVRRDSRWQLALHQQTV